MRDALAHVRKGQREMVAAAIRTAFVQEDADAATRQWRQVADSLRPRSEKLAKLMDEAEPDVLAFMTFPSEHRTKIHSTDEMDKRLLRCHGRMAVVRTTSWRRAAPRLKAPPGCLIQALPA